MLNTSRLKARASLQAGKLGHDMRGRWEDQRDGCYIQNCEQCGAELIVEANEGTFGGQATAMSCSDYYALTED